MSLEKSASVHCFGGEQARFHHASDVLACRMNFSVFFPPDFSEDSPVLYWLSGLTCTDENFAQKAGAQRTAAALGMAIVMPDTSPRGEGVPDAPDGAYDLGLSAGFYVNATCAPWSAHYRMYDYIVEELPALVERELRINPARRALCGHSMGGHGALMIALRNPHRYVSVSAFAPIAAPSRCPWGQKAFAAYLGSDQTQWANYDASQLVARATQRLPMLIDQGDADQFLHDQLYLPTFLEAAQSSGYPVEVRRRAGYDHGYYYIATFIEEHLQFHARHLR